MRTPVHIIKAQGEKRMEKKPTTDLDKYDKDKTDISRCRTIWTMKTEE